MGVKTKYPTVRVPKLTQEDNIWNYGRGDNKTMEKRF
jgi:hypothetical protein